MFLPPSQSSIESIQSCIRSNGTNGRRFECAESCDVIAYSDKADLGADGVRYITYSSLRINL